MCVYSHTYFIFILFIFDLNMDTDKQEELKQFGNKLRQLREQKGWSLRQMATNCSIDFSNLGQMEKGRVDVRFSTIIELAKALEVSPCDLFNC